MVRRLYDWENGAEIKQHSRVKLDVLDEYLREYVRVRCALPQQERFRLSVVDGFCGAGKYKCGTLGSALVILKALGEVSAEINFKRSIDGFKPINFHFYLYFNDIDASAVSMLQIEASQFIETLRVGDNAATFDVKYLVGDFSENIQSITSDIENKKVKNSLFNLDQYGYSDVSEHHLRYLLSLTRSSEVFLTFSIRSFLAFISPRRQKQPHIFGDRISEVPLDQSKKEWMAAVERVVFEELQTFASYVSPFSINNPDGWEYWLVHFANSYRARQVYNDILHRKKNSQLHVGRSGLEMLRYSSIDEASFYLFDAEGRARAREELLGDIPSFLSASARDAAMTVEEFYERTYNQTPAHSDDINSALVNSADLEVLTAHGGKRRKSQLVKRTDIVRLAPQKSFIFL